jgi:hypothetical protein
MKNLILLLILFTAFRGALFSQSCLPEGITFNTQAQIDNFQVNYPGCTEIEGDVIIDGWNGSNITDLNGLSVLISISGNLSILYIETITSLTGLDNLTSIGGSLAIGNNIALTNLVGLDHLTSINGGLWIELNDSLTSLTGLDNIDAGSINDLTITYNKSLSSCEIRSICDYIINPGGTTHIHDNKSGCDNLLEVAYACGHCLPEGITFNTQAQIDSFQVNYTGCTELFGSVTISGSDITNLNGLNILTLINGKLIVDMDNALTSLAGLEGLTSIGNFLVI